MRHAIIMATIWVDDDKIKSDNNFKKKTSELRMRGETERWDVQHQWRRENQDQHKAHETRHLTSECARSLLVSSCCRHTHSLHTTSRVCTHLLHSWSERLSSTLSSPFHPTSYSSYSPSISSSSCCPSTSTRISSNTEYSANKEMWSTDESYSLTKDATKDRDKHSVIWWMFMSSTWQASVFMGKTYSDNLQSIKKRRSHNETDVRHIWEIDIRRIRWAQWNEYN